MYKTVNQNLAPLRSFFPRYRIPIIPCLWSKAYNIKLFIYKHIHPCKPQETSC